MNTLRFTGIIALSLFLLSGDLIGADAQPERTRPAGDRPDPGDYQRPDRDGRTLRQHRGRIHRPNRPGRPPRPDRPQGIVSDEVKELLKSFEQEREQFLAQQRALLNNARNATSEQRDAIREQLRNLRDRASDRRAEIRRAIAALRSDLPGHDDVLNQAREDARRRGGDN